MEATTDNFAANNVSRYKGMNGWIQHFPHNLKPLARPSEDIWHLLARFIVRFRFVLASRPF
jgi:hypothetical protein